MGTQVLSTADYQTKPQYAVSTVLAAAVAGADGQFISWVGNAVPVNLPAWIGLERCKEGLREAGWPNPGTGTYNTAVLDSASNLTVTLAGAVPTVTEGDCVIIQGYNYSLSGDSNSAHATRQAEKFLESAKAA
jgi:hypothetical protein